MAERGETPTKYNIEKLPRWARVAFAARCARRAQPIFAKWSGAKPEHLTAIEKAISVAEQSAAAAARAAAAAAAARAAARAGIDPRLIWLDYDRLLQLAREQKWTDDTPVPPSVFPPIDGDDQPSSEAELVVKFEIPEGVSKEEFIATLYELFDSADDLHRALGGSGLKFGQAKVKDAVPVLEPTGGRS